jgi:predicted permease
LALPPPGAPSRGRWIAGRWQDLRYATRALRRAPAFSAAVVATLGLTIGPTTALLSIGNWLLWRPAPGVAAPDRLGLVTFVEAAGQTNIIRPLSFLNLDDVRDGSRTLAAITGYRETRANLATGIQPAREVRAAFVRADFFDAMGVRLVAGRAFRRDEDLPPHGAQIAAISHRLARQYFGSAGAAIGQRLLANGRPVTIVGVAPANFTGINPLNPLDAWFPASTAGYLQHATAAAPVTRNSATFNSHMFSELVIRLRPGVSFDEARAELDVLVAGLVRQYPDDNTTLSKARARVTPGIGLSSGMRERYAGSVGTLGAIGAVLLLLGSANVANLMMVRATRAARERAVRLALGASRSRLMAMQLSESLLLAMAGAGLGVALALWLKQFVAALLVPTVTTWPDFSVPLDTSVLALTLVVAASSGLAAGLLPALAAAGRASAHGVLQSGVRAVARGQRLRSGLAAVQLALSMALITGAFMLISTLGNVMANDLGFDPTGVSVHQLDATRQGYPEERQRVYYRDVFERVAATTGLGTASLSASAFGSNFRLSIQDPAGADGALLRVYLNGVTARYFDVLGLRTVQGRVFTDEEGLAPAAASPNAVVINESLARRAFGDANPIGRQILLPKTARDPSLPVTVIGVARDARWDLVGDSLLEMFLPLGHPFVRLRSLALMIRSTMPAPLVSRQVERAAMDVDPTLPVAFSGPYDLEIEYKLADRITFAWVLSLLGWLGFGLAAVGLFGLMAQSVAERTREFGIRLAIGGSRLHVFRLVLRRAAAIGAVGTVAGIGLALWGSRLIEAQLFGVTRWTPTAYVAAAASLAVVVLLAGLWPARTATRIEPVEALRAD